MADPALSRPVRLLYSQREAAELLGMSTRRLLERIRDGKLRYVLDGKRRKFRQADLDAYVAGCPVAEGGSWGCSAAPTRRSGGGRSRSKVIAFADLARRRTALRPKLS